MFSVYYVPMYIRRTSIKSRKDGKQYFTYRLVESQRLGTKVKQRTLLNLGNDFSLPREQWAELSNRIEVVNGQQEDVRFDHKFFIAKRICKHGSNVFQEWYKQQAKIKIIPRVQRHARELGVDYKEINIMNSKYRWGSCTIKNNLNFSWHLIKAPMLVIDYVIAHELAHLLESNHTPQFWNIVKTQITQFEKAKTWLKEHGDDLEMNL